MFYREMRGERSVGRPTLDLSQEGARMEVEVKLFATLRKAHLQQERIHLEERATARELLEHLEIPPAAVAVVFVNGRHAPFDQHLREGDVIALFPPIAGG
jgi:molybdopterin synthase sulfur carrier subunit